MTEVLNAEEPRHFHVGLVGYFIEGTPLSADALLVDGDSVFDLAATDDGFTCFPIFPPRALPPEIVARNFVQQDPAGVEFVAVPLEAKLRDIWMIAEVVDGTARPLYFDAEVLVHRKLPFLQE